jgi:exosortase
MSFMSLQHWVIEKKVNFQILFLLAVCALITFPSTSLLINEWLKWDQALSHGFACLALFIFFIFRQPFINNTTEKKIGWEIIFLALSSLCWCFAQLANLQLPSYIFMFITYGFLLVTFFNSQLLKTLLPVLGLFLFAIPIWSVFNDQLIELSSYIINHILKYSSLTLHIQDNQIMTPWGTIVIADGCSGLRYLVIALLMAYLLCLMNHYKLKTCLIIFIIAGLLGLMTNWIRILIIILIGYYTEMQHSLVRDHEFFGWVLFASMLFPALYFSPQYKVKLNSIATQFRFSWISVSAGLIGPVIYFLIPFNGSTNPLTLSHLQQQYPFSIERPLLSIQYPQNLSEESLSINLDQNPIHLTLLKFSPAQKNEKIVPYMGRFYDNFYWKSIHQQSLPNSHLEVFENRNYQQKVILIYKFQVGSFTAANYYQAKVLQIPAKLLNQAYFGLWLAQTSCKADCTQELASIKKLDAQW